MRIFLIILIVLLNNVCIGQGKNPKLTITHLTNDFYIYTTYGDAGNGNMFPANGMYLVTNRGIILFDTPWDSTQFQPLLDSIKTRHNQNVTACISTHFHEDRTAGLAYYRLVNIKTYTTKLTDDLSKEKNKPRAEYLVYKDTTFHIGQHSFEIYYPGKGHSPDNIVIWFGDEKILYGGCFVKSAETESIGNLSDANVEEWVSSVKKVQGKFEAPTYVIPGHQGWKDKTALKHTLKILMTHIEKNRR